MFLLSAIFGSRTSECDRTPKILPVAPPRDLWAQAGNEPAVRRAAELLTDLGPGLAKTLVWDVARAFFAHIVDLPAAERYHHAGPFGLYAHSLEVAERALRLSLSEHFAENTRAYPEDQEFRVPRLRYAAWLLGLLHDSGKVAHVEIRDGHDVWNPYDEPLETFYRNHGRERAKLTWKVGRGLDIHTWHNAYLIGRFVTGPVARYLGPRLTGQMIEQETTEAREVLRLVSEADHRSTRNSVRNPDPPPEAPAKEEILVGGGDFLGKIPELFRRAIEGGTLRAAPTPGEVVACERWVLIRYPAALQKFAFVLREQLGSTFARARALTASESGARDLARLLHEHRKLFADPETDAWKVKAKFTSDAGYDVTDAVLVDRNWLLPAVGALPLWEGEASFVRSEDERPLEVEGWKQSRPRAAAAPPPSPAAFLPTPIPVSPAPSPAPAVPARLAPPGPALTGVRKFISGEQLLDDIRRAIAEGLIPSNAWNTPCYILPETTYFTSPKGFQYLVDRGLYTRDPKREVNVYLDALAKSPVVRKKGGGKVLSQISIRHGARPMWVVSFETKGLFTDTSELARLGTWTQSSITELTEEEARAHRAAAAPGAKEAPRA